MGHLIITAALAVIGVPFAILVSAAGKLVADDLKAWAPRLTKGLIDRAIAMLPKDQQRRYEEEWPSHINEVPGELSKIFAAIGLIFAARRILPAIDESEIYEGSLTGLWAVLKRTEDIVLAILMLILFGPLMLAIAAVIKLNSRGPVLFRLKRLGLNNNAFEMLKFRTMTHGLGPDREVPQAQRDHPRVTRVGRFLRRTSLDELPRLLNVLNGSMSLVGPRPLALTYNDEYAAVIVRYMGRHRFRPGITGWAQVNGFRGDIDTLEKLQRRIDYDLAYIKKRSLLHDLNILLKTIMFSFRNTNAY